jgi:DNA invertase Pin-like site-specific DNA recombinase
MTQQRARYVSYLRVSSQKQGKSGLGLEAQRTMIADFVRSINGRIVAEYTEVESGKLANRPELSKALAACRIHNAVLIVAKLDRLARNVAFVSNLMESNAEFTACDFPQANRFMIHMLSAVAEYEAKLISERTKAALAQAKRRGVQLGGDRGNILRIQRKGSRAGNVVRSAKARQRSADLLPVIDSIRGEGVTSLRQIADGLNTKGIPAPRGGAWSAVQVLRVINHSTG